MKHLAVLGGGSWGTALGTVLAPNFSNIRMWIHDPARAAEVESVRVNQRYLPGVSLPKNLTVSCSAETVLENADAILVAIPSRYLRGALTAIGPAIPRGVPVVSTTKGLEPGTLLRMTELVGQSIGQWNPILALSGPSFAEEVARNLPAAVVVAGRAEPSREIQRAFARPNFRLYTSEDVIGVEIGGALKNVIAIGSGMATGLGLGHNAVAALVTRGLAEITRLAAELGAQPRTLAGLAGLGDLVLTCTGSLSRNRELGLALTGSRATNEVLEANTMTTEGVRTAGAAVALGRRYDVELPIAEQMAAVLESERRPADAIRILMERSLKEE